VRLWSLDRNLAKFVNVWNHGQLLLYQILVLFLRNYNDTESFLFKWEMVKVFVFVLSVFECCVFGAILHKVLKVKKLFAKSSLFIKVISQVNLKSSKVDGENLSISACVQKMFSKLNFDDFGIYFSFVFIFMNSVEVKKLLHMLEIGVKFSFICVLDNHISAL